jgi:indolepyruvate ferredoxin oxidoreductase
VFIDEAVCEGCGDCGAKSNCLSVQPVDTEYGRKTRIHQSSCNQDYTCLDGDCPSFVTVTETRRSRRRRARRLAATSTAPAEAGGGGAPALDASFPEPEREPLDGTHDIYMTGVGGTGVITASQILATAALLDGLHVAGVDQTGLSQKGGPVVSHLRVGAQPFEGAGTIGAGAADTYLAFDLLVGAAPVHLAYARHGTRTAVSTSKVPTGAMVSDPALAFPAVDALVGAIGGRTGGVDVHLDSVALAERLFGDHMMANVLLLGAAYQAGMLPVTADAIERAIELNGVARDQNRQAFRWGRRYTLDPGGVARAAYGAAPVPVAISSNGHGPRPAAALLQGAGFTGELARLLEVRVPELAAYQDDAYARAYVDFVARVVEAERAAVPGATRLAEAVARSLFQLMAYKDEYEVARLYLRDDFAATLRAEAPDGGAVRVLLHPPLLRALGVRRKLAFGPWVRPAFRVLRGMRRVRGTRLDPFGATKVRRTERALVAEYRGLVERALHELSAETYDRAVALAELPAMVRGYEQVKLENVERFRAEVRALGF